MLSAGEDHTLGSSYKRAFNALGHEATLIDPMLTLNAWPLWRNRVTRRLLERSLIEKFNRNWLPQLLLHDADMVFVGKGAWATPWLWHAYRAARPNVPLVCYNADDPISTYSRGGNRPWVTESIGCFDLFCTYKSTLLDPLRNLTSGRVIQIPFAWDPDVHPRHTAEGFELDLIFVGNGDPFREEWLERILDQPATDSWRVAVFGQWRPAKSARLRDAIRPLPLYGIDMAKAIASAKISLNILRQQNEGSHNMRTFEIPGCGGLMASQDSVEQRDFFPTSEAALYFSDAQDAVARINEVIRDDARGSAMRARAGEIVRSHTYLERAKVLLECLS